MHRTSGTEAPSPGRPWVLGGPCVLCYLCVPLGTLTPTAAQNNQDKLQSTEKETEAESRLRFKSKWVLPQTSPIPSI